MSHKILTINPGSTSTKVALFEEEAMIFSLNVEHSTEELAGFPDVIAQYDYRLKMVKEAIEANDIDIRTLSAVVGRGGILPPIHAGAYFVNDKMIEDLKLPGAIHASNLGAMLALGIAKPLEIPALIYDAVSSDELREVARITGFPEYRRTSKCHVLNSKAMTRHFAALNGKKYEDVKVIVAHLGGGISISAHENGRIVDSAGDDEGPFGPERSGVAPLFFVVDLCYSGKDKSDVLKKIRGGGGLKAHLGTSDVREIEARIEKGDEHAKLIYDAQIYQIAKGIGLMLPMMDRVDAIILTGGISYSKTLTERVKAMVDRYAPVVILPGENEMESLALGGLRVLRGEETARIYE